MKRYWALIAISTIAGAVLLLFLPKAFSVPIYVLALGLALFGAIGLQSEAIRTGRAWRLMEDTQRAGSGEPAHSAKHV